MSSGPPTERTAATAAVGAPPEQGALRLVISTEDGLSVHALPAAGTATIGRSRRADLRVEAPSVSGVHAQVHVGAKGAAAIEDLGSSNGTRMRGAALVPKQLYPLLPGEVVDLGDAMVILQRGAAIGVRPRLCTHGAFQTQLAAECARAAACGSTVAVLQALAPAGFDALALEAAMIDALGPHDLIAARSLSAYEIMLFGAGREAARDHRASLAKLGLVTGSACFPEDTDDPTALLSLATPAGAPPAAATALGSVVIQNPAMEHIYRLVSRIAPSEISVLIAGETGVGKEIMAEAVHRASARAGGPLLRLNCGAFVDSLLESELFGHCKGAFTGAVKDKPGLFEAANGGTVFLDEVGELPQQVQVKLLRVLEERKVRRVGGVESQPIDIRLVAATNRNLDVEIAEGRFREDLFYRLNGITLYLPPLRERLDEIEALAHAFGRRAAPGGVTFSDAAIAHLLDQRWPGNVRQLKNTVERAVVLSGGDPITVEHLTPPHMPAGSGPSVPVAVPAEVAVGPAGSLDDDLRELERKRIMEALEQCGGNQTRAAKQLGISRKKLIARLETHRIPRPRKR